MRNYKMIVSYDGTRYKGWQRLSTGEATIQGIIEATLSAEVGYEVKIHGSGRTDGGVHAKGQVANVKISRKIEEETFLEGLNQNLPKDIRIINVSLVTNNFHSRYGAKGKHYSYTIDTGEKPNVFMRKYAYSFTDFLDLEKMQQGANVLVGTHDFEAFSDKKDDKSSIRTIYNITIKQKKNILRIDYYGNGFLNHMVRILTGTLLQVGSGQKEIGDINKALETKERIDAGYMAAAKGLCLEEVYYDSIEAAVPHLCR